jgi:hypothetical protein
MERWVYIDIGDVVRADEEGNPLDHEGNLVCELSDIDDHATGELIAAAPELGDALERAFLFICNTNDLGPTNDRTVAGKLIDSLRCALSTYTDFKYREQVSA